ncbi:MAG TPA: hypothetical protein VF409_07215 [Sphingomonas sp.]
MPNPVMEMLRQYPASLVFPIGATVVAFLGLKAFKSFPNNELRVASAAVAIGTVIGFCAAFAYIYADISGWAVLLVPFLLGPIFVGAAVTGLLLAAASLAIKLLLRLIRS